MKPPRGRAALVNGAADLPARLTPRPLVAPGPVVLLALPILVREMLRVKMMYHLRVHLHLLRPVVAPRHGPRSASSRPVKRRHAAVRVLLRVHRLPRFPRLVPGHRREAARPHAALILERSRAVVLAIWTRLLRRLAAANEGMSRAVPDAEKLLAGLRALPVVHARHLLRRLRASRTPVGLKRHLVRRRFAKLQFVAQNCTLRLGDQCLPPPPMRPPALRLRGILPVDLPGPRLPRAPHRGPRLLKGRAVPRSDASPRLFARTILISCIHDPL